MTFYTSSLWFRSASSYLANSAITTEHKDRNVMLARRLLIAFALLHTAFAQSSASLVAASSTSSAASVAHTVAVGLTGFVFNPANITANVGDTVVFRFEGQGHTVVKASYGNPCIPYDTIYRGEPSFFSGWFNGTDTLSADVSRNIQYWYLRDSPPYSRRPGTSLSTTLLQSSTIAPR